MGRQDPEPRLVETRREAGLPLEGQRIVGRLGTARTGHRAGREKVTRRPPFGLGLRTLDREVRARPVEPHHLTAKRPVEPDSDPQVDVSVEHL